MKWRGASACGRCSPSGRTARSCCAAGSSSPRRIACWWSRTSSRPADRRARRCRSRRRRADASSAPRRSSIAAAAGLARRPVSVAGLAHAAHLRAGRLPLVRAGTAGREAGVQARRVSRTFKLTLAYDGTEFVGWQRQASGVSIQGLLEDALSELDGRAVTVIGAGRTDAGVHALGQVASGRARTRIDAAAVVRARQQPPAGCGPRPRRVAGRPGLPRALRCAPKTYRYRIWNAGVMSPFERSYAWHVPDGARRRRDGRRGGRARAARTTSRRFKGPAATRRRPSARWCGRRSSATPVLR